MNIQVDEEHVIGDVFYYSEEKKLLVLKEQFEGTDKFDLRFINTDSITNIKIVSRKNLDVGTCEERGHRLVYS